MLKQLIHNGILIPPRPEPLGLTITVRGRKLALTPDQEEMALAWARKKDTPYVEDEVFATNFLRDFSAALGIEPALQLSEVDFSACYAAIEAERAAKEALSKEERKALAAERKAQREALKARYGYAIVNGQRVELGTYMTEPSGIFMGRGQHPLRGRWKPGAQQRDVTLNLSPDAPRPEGDWGEIVWQPDSMWVARWEDKLSAKLKYIWLSDTAPVKQQREATKFDKAVELDAQLARVRAHIEADLQHENPRTRMLAMACYLIDTLCLRVGDEKDPDEADTVGATTLRPEHVMLGEGEEVEFKFLGKDSVEWHKKLALPAVVRENLAELIRNARPARSASEDRHHPTRNKPQLFPDVGSHDVNAYLSSIMPGLTAKVFRTHHATQAVEQSLKRSGVQAEHPEYRKWEAVALANLQAAVLCNHTKKATGNWEVAREKFQQRAQKAEARVALLREEVQRLSEELTALKQEAKTQTEAAATPEQRQKVRAQFKKRLDKIQARLENAKERRSKAQVELGKIKAQMTLTGKKRTWNLGTSLKSYIDPRVYHQWGQQVNYNVLARYYPAILQRKFAWVQMLGGNTEENLEELEKITVRTCMADDLAAVGQLLQAMAQEHPTLNLPCEVDEIRARYLPALDKDWQEALVALDEDAKVIGFAVIGPEWSDDGQPALDFFAALRAEDCSPVLVRLLAEEVRRRVQTYALHNPKKVIVLAPRERQGSACARELYIALGLEEDEEDAGTFAESALEPQTEGLETELSEA